MVDLKGIGDKQLTQIELLSEMNEKLFEINRNLKMVTNILTILFALFLISLILTITAL